MLLPFLKNNQIDMKHSYVIGDRPSDALLAKNIGCQSITICDDHSVSSNENWKDVQTHSFSHWQK